MSAPDRRAMLDRADRTLSLRRQCALLGVARSGVYRPRKPANDNDAALMRWIDELFTAWPFLGSRRMTAMLRAEGVFVNRKRVQRLMRLMGIAALGPRPRTSKPAHGHKIYPYLLRNLTIERANQVWAADITYIPIGRGFLYLVAIIDWAAARCWRGGCRTRWTGRSVLRRSDEALWRSSASPEIFNTDQGSQGGFKWSSQHLDGSCDEHSKTALGSFWAGALVLTRSTAGGRARGAAAILGSDCGGHGE